jgi:3-dehydroquinate synthase
MIYQTISVSLPDHSYPIYIGSDILADPKILTSHLSGHQVLIVTQDNIASAHLSALQTVLVNYQCDVFFLPDGESFKNIQEWQKIVDVLLERKHERTTTLIALGGGVVGDMAGFAAACYQRGVNYIQIPTTLIAQVDSAMGGKTGVNHALGKNMIGAFYQPQAVFTDVKMLMTLPQRQFVSGLAEVIKYGLIRDEEFFLWLENNVGAYLNRDEQALLYIVSRSAAIKAEIVMQDEKDHGLRNLLNFGHTFGHALETALAYQAILHGEAVAIGMVIAAELSAALGYISARDVERVVDLLKSCGLLHTLAAFPDVSELMISIERDKKVMNKKLNFILLKKIGEGVKVSDVALLPIENSILRTSRRIV